MIDNPFTGERPAKLQLGEAKRLLDVQKDYALMTPAMLMTHALMPVDPVQDFVERQTDEPDIGILVFQDAPIFSGLILPGGDDRWNYTLIAVERSAWEKLQVHLSGCASIDRSRRLLMHSWPHLVWIADALAKQYGLEQPQKIPVTAYGVRGNRYCAWLDGAEIPSVRVGGPNQEMQALAAQLLS